LAEILAAGKEFSRLYFSGQSRNGAEIATKNTKRHEKEEGKARDETLRSL